jgi:hypothetical protein
MKMKMVAERRAIDKIFKRRDRYDIPDWQRDKVWDATRKRRLIDSILHGWKLPKFYFVKTSDDGFEVVDGQQRLSAIWEFCANELTLSPDTAKKFGGSKYRDLPQTVADAFDDFEIEYDVIEDATEKELKEFFQRVQAGLPTTSSEKLNATHSKLRDYCRKAAGHSFFSKTVAIPNTRYAHFDIVAKVATIEIEGFATGLRFDEIKGVFEAQTNFSATSAVAKRIDASLDLLRSAFKGHGDVLRTRTVVQSLLTLACKIVATDRQQEKGVAVEVRNFFEAFQAELVKQIEMGQAATDSDFLTFQQSVNANVKGGAKVRHQILLRQLFRLSPSLADLFDPSVIAESGVSGRISNLGDSIAQLVGQINQKHAASRGDDLFKATNKSAQALIAIKKPVKTLLHYGSLIDNLYFLFRESAGSRLSPWPPSLADVNELRTDLRHDIDHGPTNKIRSKRRSLGRVFAKYAGGGTPNTIDPARFSLMQSNLLTTVEGDLRALLANIP